MEITKLTSVVIATTIIVGCSTSASFVKTGNYNPDLNKRNKCEVTVYTTQPSNIFHEIGLIEFSGDFWGGKLGGADSVTQAKEKSSNLVCNNGGNGLLLWEANGVGNYKKATVIYVE